MFRNYIKLAVRNLLKNKLFSLVNFAGLSLGIAASLILFLYIENESGYDTFHADVNTIYRLRCDNLENGKYSERMARTNGPVGKELKERFPEVDKVVQLNRDEMAGMISNDRFTFRLKNSFFASEDFFNVFSYHLIKGDPNTALKELDAIVLSESLAKKFFGTEDPVGKTLQFNRKYPMKVTGVFKDVPPNSHLKFESLISYKSLLTYVAPYLETEWNGGESNYTYVKLKPGTDPKQLEKKFPAMVKDKLGAAFFAQGHDKQYFLQPLRDIHLNSHYDGEIEANGDGRALKFFVIIAFVIMVIAWINYINLSIVKSFERYKEIGIRIVSGGAKGEIRRQFIIEAVLFNLLCVAFAIFIAKTVYPYFSDYTGMEINEVTWASKDVWLRFFVAIVAGTVLSSIYPAFVLTSVNPVAVLKGLKNKASTGLSFRKALITFQFAISIALIIGTIVIIKQVSFMQNYNTGVNIEQTLVIHKPSLIDSTWFQKLDAFKNNLKQHTFIKNVCLSRYVPGESIDYSQGFVKQANNPSKKTALLYNNFSDHEFIDLYKLKLIAGREFVAGKKNCEIIINRKALAQLDFKKPEEAIGQKIYNDGWKYEHTIVGVIEDFHQRSLKENFLPMAFMQFENPGLSNKFSVKIQTEDMKTAIAQIEKTWQTVFPGNAFEYFFLDEQYNNQYKADIQFGSIFLLFSTLAIVIACIGLFALTLYTIVHRTKEIAIRKVIGASAYQVFHILTKDYVWLISIATLIAIPSMYYIMSKWLEHYAYRIELSMWFFIVPVFILLVVVLASISFQVIKAIRTNPIKSLRTE